MTVIDEKKIGSEVLGETSDEIVGEKVDDDVERRVEKRTGGDFAKQRKKPKRLRRRKGHVVVLLGSYREGCRRVELSSRLGLFPSERKGCWHGGCLSLSYYLIVGPAFAGIEKTGETS